MFSSRSHLRSLAEARVKLSRRERPACSPGCEKLLEEDAWDWHEQGLVPERGTLRWDQLDTRPAPLGQEHSLFRPARATSSRISRHTSQAERADPAPGPLAGLGRSCCSAASSWTCKHVHTQGARDEGELAVAPGVGLPAHTPSPSFPTVLGVRSVSAAPTLTLLLISGLLGMLCVKATRVDSARPRTRRVSPSGLSAAFWRTCRRALTPYDQFLLQKPLGPRPGPLRRLTRATFPFSEVRFTK